MTQRAERPRETRVFRSGHLTWVFGPGTVYVQGDCYDSEPSWDPNAGDYVWPSAVLLEHFESDPNADEITDIFVDVGL